LQFNCCVQLAVPQCLASVPMSLANYARGIDHHKVDIEVHISLLSGQTTVLQLEPHTRIDLVKATLGEELCVALILVVLLHGQRILQDTECLAELLSDCQGPGFGDEEEPKLHLNAAVSIEPARNLVASDEQAAQRTALEMLAALPEAVPCPADHVAATLAAASQPVRRRAMRETLDLARQNGSGPKRARLVALASAVLRKDPALANFLWLFAGQMKGVLGDQDKCWRDLEEQAKLYMVDPEDPYY